jgi:hypothetical protein
LTSPELKVIQTGTNAGPGAQFTLFASQRAANGEADDATPEKRSTRVSEARK